MKKNYTLLLFFLSFFLIQKIVAKGPVSHVCKSTVYVSLGDDGEAVVDASTFIIPDDDCCPSGTITYEVAKDGGIFQTELFLSCDNLGQTLINVRSTDCLGNAQTCETVVIAQANIGNCDDPCPSCCFPILVAEPMLVAISDEGNVKVNADQFAEASFSPCGNDPLTFSFSPDPTDDLRTFTCDDLGTQVLSVWATDGNNTQNFVEVLVILQDEQEACSSLMCLPRARMRTGMVVEVQYDSSPTCIKASDFDLDCALSACISTTSYSLAFSDDPSDTERCFSCADLGPQEVEVFVIDNLGFFNSVKASVVVQANAGQCSSQIPFSPNDDVCDAINLDNVFGEDCGVTFINIDATAEANEIAPSMGSCTSQNTWCDSGAEHSVWFTFTAPAAESVTIFTEGFLDTQLALWDADDCTAISDGDATLVVANDDIPNNSIGNSSITANCLTVGKTYFLQVDGKQGQEGGFDLTIVAEGTSCLVVPAPAGMTLNCGVADIPTVTSTGAGEWINITDSDGRLVASINDMGQTLGEVSADLLINGDDVRTDDFGNHYLDRNWVITPTEQPTGNVLVRFYFEPEELDALVDVSPIVNGLDDLFGTKISNGECGDYPGMPGDLIEPKNTFFQNAEFLACEFEIDGFSSFYLHGPMGLTSIFERKNPGNIEVYPNPATDELFVNIPSPILSENPTVYIMDVNGKTIGEGQQLIDGKINVGSFLPGVYFVKIKVGNEMLTSRFLKMD